MVGYVTNKCGFGMNWTLYFSWTCIIERNIRRVYIVCTICGISTVFHYTQKKKLFKYMKTVNQIKNTFWGLEQEICWDWLYEQQEGNIYGKTSENFMYFNMFFLNSLFRTIILFYLIDYVSRSMNEIYRMHLGI